MSSEANNTPKVWLFTFALLAGLLYATVHIVNGWVFHTFEFSEHISFIYLPSFLRLFNVLVLGLVWGTFGTAFGGVLLYFWAHDSWAICLCNAVVSASSAVLAVWALRFLQQRKISMVLLSDLLKLALLCSLLNVFLHHLMWSSLDPSQLIASNQLAVMVMGDINGAIAGALFLRWLASRTTLIARIREKASVQSMPD